MRSSSIRMQLFSAAILVVDSQVFGESGYAMSFANTVLFQFDTSTPGALREIGPFDGVTLGSVKAIDFRPSTGELYALATGGGGSAAQVFTVNLETASLTPRGPMFSLAGNTSADVSIDFDPVSDQLRIVTRDEFENNFRWDARAQEFVQSDGDLTYAASNPVQGGLSAIGIAYDRNDNDLTTGSTLYAYDFDNDDLATIGDIDGSPTSADLGLAFTVSRDTGVFARANLGFDISATTGIAYVAASTFGGPNPSQLYTVNLATGHHTLMGDFGISLRDISISIPEPSYLALFVIAGRVARRRWS